MNRYFKFLILLGIILRISGSHASNLTKQKANLVGIDPRTHAIITNQHTGLRQYNATLDMTSINPPTGKPWYEFFISFDPLTEYRIANIPYETQTVHMNVPLLKQTNRMLLRLPYINPYGFKPELGAIFKERLALIILPPEMLKNVLPTLIQKELSKKLTIDSNNLIPKLKNINTLFNAVILGNNLQYGPMISEQSPADAIYNLRYHYWATLYHNLHQIQDPTDPYKFFISKLKDFNEPTEMGLFEPNGIAYVNQDEANSIAFNILKPQNIYWHQALSPNNARFKIDMSRQLSSFWAVAISPDQQYVNITYFLLANSEKIKALLADTLFISNNLEDLKIITNNFRIKYQNWLSDEDLKALSAWVNTIATAVTDAKTAKVSHPPKTNLEQAKTSLLNLASTLNTLSSR